MAKKNTLNPGPKNSGIRRNRPEQILERSGLADLEVTRNEIYSFKTAFKKDEKSELDLDTKPSVELSLRYRMPKKLEKVSEETIKKMAHWLNEQRRLGENEREEYMARLAKWRQMWLDFESTGMNPAFEGSQDVHIPMMFEKIKAMAARVYQAIYGLDPIFTLRPRSAVAEERKNLKETILNWAIKEYANKGDGWKKVIDQDIWNFVADGTSITKQYWLRDVYNYVDVEQKIRRPITLDQHGRPLIDEKEVEKEEVVFDCPILDVVPIEDIEFIGARGDDIDNVDAICHRQLYTKSDLIKLAHQGFFKEEAITELLKNQPQDSVDTLHQTSANWMQQEVKDYTSGLEKGANPAGHKAYIINEYYFRYDIEGTGVNQELVAWIADKGNLVLRLTYLNRVCPGGKRPFVVKKFIPRPGSIYGIGFGEILSGLNHETDVIHNQRMDFGNLQNVPFFFYRAASGLNPQELRLGPGKGIPVDDPNGDVSFPRMGGTTAYGFQEEATVREYANNVSGISELVLGSQSAQGAARTATGAAALANSANVILDSHIERYKEGFRKNLQILDKQLQELLPLGTVVRVTGPEGKDLYNTFNDRLALNFNVEFDLEGNSTNSNKAIERETAQMLLQTLTNPIMLQAGIVGADNIYQATRNLLQKFEIKNVDAYLTKPENVLESPYSAKDELSAILFGVKPPLVIKDRHLDKVQFFNEFEQSEDFSFLTPEHMPLYNEVKNFHEQMANAVMTQARDPQAQANLNPALAAQIASGLGVPQGAPAQQIGDLTGGSQ